MPVAARGTLTWMMQLRQDIQEEGEAHSMIHRPRQWILNELTLVFHAI